MTSERPIDFCLHLAAAIRQGKKTLAYKPIPAAALARYLADGSVPAPVYGGAGDHLWLREPFVRAQNGVVYAGASATTKYDTKVGDGVGRPILPSTQMTRDQASILLAISEVVVVRLDDDLTDATALAAGMDPRDARSPRDEFVAQWDEAYPGGLAVASNPPVWRIAFSVLVNERG